MVSEVALDVRANVAGDLWGICKIRGIYLLERCTKAIAPCDIDRAILRSGAAWQKPSRLDNAVHDRVRSTNDEWSREVPVLKKRVSRSISDLVVSGVDLDVKTKVQRIWGGKPDYLLEMCARAIAPYYDISVQLFAV